jgi:hypothetical protein
MGNYLKGDSEEVEVPLVKGADSEEVEVQQIVKRLMAGDGGLDDGPKNAICVEYFPRAPGMGVAVCSVCGLPIQVAFYQGTDGGYVHRKCMPPSSKDKNNNNANKEVRPRNADIREFLHEQFFVLLLNNMPIRPLKDGQECTDREFHRVYAKTWQLAIGPTPSLRELREYAYTFLKGKCDPTSVEAAIANPEVSSNEFKWPKINDTECVRIVEKTVGDYGLVLIWGRNLDETRDIKRFPEI